LLVNLKNTHFVSVLFFVSYFLVPEIGENATMGVFLSSLIKNKYIPNITGISSAMKNFTYRQAVQYRNDGI